MATTLFNNLILASARRLKDPRTDPTAAGDSGKRFSSALLSEYGNRAVRDFIEERVTADPTGFARAFPEYIRETAPITLVAGSSYASVALPTDVWYVSDVTKSDYSLRFYKIPQQLVESVKAGIDPVIVPSAAMPVWWQENNNLCALPANTAIAVIARYLRTHQDITSTLGSSTSGKWQTGGTTTFSTTGNTLTIGAISAVLASTDVNKEIMFYDATAGKVYVGRIASVTSSTVCTIYGYGIPTANLSNITMLLISDTSPDSADLTLNLSWHGEIIDRMVAFGEADRKNGVVQ